MPGGDHAYALAKLPFCTVLGSARRYMESVCGILPSADEVSSLPVPTFTRRFIHVCRLNFNECVQVKPNIRAYKACVQCWFLAR